ncbi:MAG TPA: hypothetical protein VGC13_22290 [Longimicrobium sp.]|uniref:hypothetical protein n=1 Tax=Longimicrobium sp. TaxID=2029185 RepID=UPI002EDAA136
MSGTETPTTSHGGPSATWVAEGSLGGRDYAVRRKDGEPEALVCMTCLSETPVTSEGGVHGLAERFTGHVCAAASAAPAAARPARARTAAAGAVTTTTKNNNSTAGGGEGEGA